MSRFVSTEKDKHASTIEWTEYAEGSPVREKITLVFTTILVLSLQLVFRATVLARHLNY